MKMNHTFEEIRMNAQNKEKKSDESQAYETARNQLENYEEFDEAWNFIITEHLTKTVRVRAKNRREAYDKIITLLSSDLLTLGADDFSDRDIQGLDEVNVENPEMINDSSYPVDEDYSEKI